MRAPGLRLLTTTLSPVCVDVGVVAEVIEVCIQIYKTYKKKLMSYDNHRISSRKFLNSVGFFLGGGGVSFLVHM